MLDGFAGVLVDAGSEAGEGFKLLERQMPGIQLTLICISR